MIKRFKTLTKALQYCQLNYHFCSLPLPAFMHREILLFAGDYS